MNWLKNYFSIVDLSKTLKLELSCKLCKIFETSVFVTTDHEKHLDIQMLIILMRQGYMSCV